MLQSAWEGGRSVFIHRPRHGRTPDAAKDLPYGLASISSVFKNLPKDSSICLVFHAQSSLPLLLATYILRIIYGVRNRTKLVYDIHDLHEHEPYRSRMETLRYGILRYFPLKWLERWAVSRRNVDVITVSDGLAATVADWYGGSVPRVVHSAMLPRRSAAELSEIPRIARALLFFGTAERLPFEIIDEVGRAGFDLHLYGRFGGQEGLENIIGREIPGHVKVFGEYLPSDLDFVSQYEYLLIYKPKDMRKNFRYSLPNKFFQSLGYGTSIIISPNFEEMRQVASVVPGACVDLVQSSGIVDSIFRLEKLRNRESVADMVGLAYQLHENAKKQYLSVVAADS